MVRKWRVVQRHYLYCITASLYSHSCQHWKSSISTHVCLPWLPFGIVIAQSRLSVGVLGVETTKCGGQSQIIDWNSRFFPFPFLSSTDTYVIFSQTDHTKAKNKTPEKPPCNYFPTIKAQMPCYFCVVCDEAGTCGSFVFSYRGFCGSVQGGGDVAAVWCCSGSPSQPCVTQFVCPAGTALLLQSALPAPVLKKVRNQSCNSFLL